jgi:predicted nucleotidyltransferase
MFCGKLCNSCENKVLKSSFRGNRFEFLQLGKGLPGWAKMNIDDQVRAKRTDILRFAREHGARNIHPFGSVARGETTPNSDVGFLVELEPGSNLPDLSRLLLALQDLLGCKVDVVTEKALIYLANVQVLTHIHLLRSASSWSL